MPLARVRASVPRNVEVKRAAVLFVDVCDSTAYFDRHGELAGRNRIKRALKAVRRALEAHEGNVVRVIGDALLVVFQEPLALVRGAAAAQWDLEEAESKVPRADRVRIHCGAHVGNVVFEESGNLFGDILNVASRLQDLAGPDQIYVTGQLMKQLPSADRPVSRRVGDFKLAGKRSETEVYEVLWKTDDVTDTLVPRGRHAETSIELRFEKRKVSLAPTRDKLSVGRGLENDLVVDDRAVSRIHAEIVQRAGRCYLVDRSTNGTYVRPGRRRPYFLHRDELLLEGEGQFSLGRADGPPVTYAVK